MVNANNVPQIVSPEASHLAPLHKWLLLDAVLTTLHNILVEFVSVFWQTQAGSSVSELLKMQLQTIPLDSPSEKYF